MVFLSLARPTRDEIASFLSKRTGFCYDESLVGSSKGGLPFPDSVRRGFYVVDHHRTQIGAGKAVYSAARDVLSRWGHFQLGWTFVDPGTPIRTGEKVCVNANFLLWTLNPLKILYVEDVMPGAQAKASPTTVALRKKAASSPHNALSQVSPQGPTGGDVKARFAFGHGTLRGHMLAGEERFSLEWKTDDSVWFESCAFSRPAGPIALLTYPAVRLCQWRFAHDASRAVREAVGKATAKL
eukprot:jgi/Mesvir1/6701/Mv13734-RA.1